MVGVVRLDRLHLVLSYKAESENTLLECVPFSKFLSCERIGALMKSINETTSIEAVSNIIKRVRGEKPFALGVVMNGKIEHYVGFLCQQHPSLPATLCVWRAGIIKIKT